MRTPATAAVARPRAAGIAGLLSMAAVMPLALYVVGVVAGLVATTFVNYPTNEGSAYYVDVARNLAGGRGLVIDTLWSYATPPLILPRPAFELWQPMASLVAAVPMMLLGTTFAAAQYGGVLLGAVLAPLTWAIARDAAPAMDVPANRVPMVAAAAGLVAAVSAPVVVATAVPDSTLPFTVFATLACWLAPRAWAAVGRPYAALAVGAALGLAYLSRHEAIYVGIVVLVAGVGAARTWRWLMPEVVGGLVVVGPWLLRNVSVFGTPLPGQALDNAFLTSNEQIFDYGSRPGLARFLDQGVGGIVGHIVGAAAHNLIDVVLISGAPVGAVGLVVVVWLVARRRWHSLRGTSLWLLLASGGLTFAVATAVFPVASMWGTFQHASGPLLISLTVAAVIGGDALVDYVRRRRKWQRANAWMAGFSLGIVALALAVLNLAFLSVGARDTAERYRVLDTAVGVQPESLHHPPVISDHPIWLADNLTPTLALPAQAPDVVLRLAADFGAQLIAIGEGRGDYPEAFRSGPLAYCFAERPVAPTPPGLALFAINQECLR